jgi:hypothetical protein
LSDFVHFGVPTALAGLRWRRIAPVAAMHLAALATLVLTEDGLFHQAVFLLTWCLLNCLWLVVLRRPGLAAALSLATILGLIAVSQFKYRMLEMTLSAIDVMIADTDTTTFLLSIFPVLRTAATVAAVAAIAAAILIWRFDPYRVARVPALVGASACVVALVAFETFVPMNPFEIFSGINHVSNFARSGVDAMSEYMRHGYLESDPSTGDRLAPAHSACRPARKPPNIILVHDESSFDIRNVPGIQVPPGYGSHFRSFDGRERNFIIDGSGGPSWYTEYDILTGLSARSYGPFMFNVTRIAANRVARGLPQALRDCGYRTITLFPWYGAFLGTRAFQTGVGIERFSDITETGSATDLQPDSWYYDRALRVIGNELGGKPLFVYVYLELNHFPWTSPSHPELTPGWKGLGNEPEVDEYIRRQTASARALVEFRDRLRRQFPGEPFLIVRYGDHQPPIAAHMLEPSLDPVERARRISTYDPTYFTTYYALDAVNFDPVDVTSALDTLEAPYLPLVIQESAGLPLDPSFIEEKQILRRCNGRFYACSAGAEARRFNRLLIDAGLIKGL